MAENHDPDLKQYLLTWKSRINRYLEDYFKGRGSRFETLINAVNYSLFAGGKRIRPIISVACCELFGKDGETSLPFGCSIELIHNFSLIHDDLPCMDNDDLRRGKPTSHKVYGEAQAVLAGDAMFAESFRMITQHAVANGEDLQASVEILNFILDAVGLEGMVGGQSLEIQNASKPIPIQTLEVIHQNKTARLFSASAFAGARAAGANKQDLDRTIDYGMNIGMAFQIVDDVLDFSGQVKGRKKSANADPDGLTTYPTLLGVEESINAAKEHVARAKKTLDPYDNRADILRALADFIVKRKF